ncbi:MAG TPA: alpha-amylase family glycosyl hydrolase [Devosia sp.]|jgi:alpha-glucosidase|uniref:alpha-amylase family glycosyl hydrolase n=1 Tax=Devosia sp. TaxID=1871048 RepID=UPI002F91E1C8
MRPWWQDAVGYAIFPLSFQDSDGDGWGDINGITSRLDYMQWLGIDLIWLGPLYRSPLIDAGYDIADFEAIDPRFGTLADFDRMLAEIHHRGMRLVMDFVPNHTSDQHEWFKQSRSSRTDPKRDWYIWRDGKSDGQPPSNWIDNTKQPAWTWDEATGQWYYHLFLPSQPDLNLRNPDVIDAIERGMAFWLDRGIDGFRLDSAMNLFEDEFLRDEPMDDDLDSEPPGWMDHVFSSDRPETHRLIARFRRLLDRYGDKVFIGEVQAPLARFMRYYGQTEPMLHLPFNTQVMKTKPWKARKVDASIEQFMQLLPEHGWPNWVIGSHDVPRLASRLGPAQARVASFLLLTLPGTPFIYYGDELGLERSKFSPEQAVDPYEPFGLGRDAERGPMPWSNEANGGFTTGKPWLPLGENWKSCNVETAREDQRSMLHLHRQLIALRQDHPALRGKGYEPAWGNDELLAFYRTGDGKRYLVAANLSMTPQSMPLEGDGKILVSTALSRSENVQGHVSLEPNEAVLIQLASES